MCLQNHFSVQTEDMQTASLEEIALTLLQRKFVLSAVLLTLLFIPVFCFSTVVFSQEINESELQLGLDEDPLSEKDAELGLDEDPLVEADPELGLDEDPLSEKEAELGLDEDPFAETELEPGLDEDPLAGKEAGLGLDEDPFAETGAELGLDEDPLMEVTEPEVSEDEAEEEEEFQPRVTFNHKVKTLMGGSETKGLSMLDPLLTEIRELRFVTTYDQSVKVQTSPQMYNFFRLSISFSQSYELKKERIFDGYASLREIYSNYRTGAHQLRYGTQIFSLGKVDLDKVIDVLHMNNIMGRYTFEPDDSKDSIPSIRYNWFRGAHTATVYLSPIRQQTFGMKFAELREEIEKKEKDDESGKVSFLRDYYGLQYQWTGDVFDARVGMFHWFDANPHIKFEYQRILDNETTTLQGSFEKMLSNYEEKETRSDFYTLELDAVWRDMVWKLETGLFKKRNLYSYEIPEGRHIRLSTVRTPHFAWATSFESTSPYFYWLMIYSQRKSFDVPENSHIFLYENEAALVAKKRNISRNQISGVAVIKTPDNSLRVTLLNYQTWPFVQHGFASIFTWEQYKQNMELELKYFRLETEGQKMLANKIITNQVFLTYTQKFTAR